MLHEPFGAGEQVAAMLWLSRDTRKAHVSAQFLEKAFLILSQVIQDSLHADWCSKAAGTGKARIAVAPAALAIRE